MPPVPALRCRPRSMASPSSGGTRCALKESGVTRMPVFRGEWEQKQLNFDFSATFSNFKNYLFFFFIFPTKTCFLDRWKRNKTKHYPISCSQWHQWPVYVVEITHSSSFSVTKPCWSFRKMHISFFLSTSVTSYHEWKWRPSLHEVTQSLLGTIRFSSAKPSHCSNFNSQCNLLPQ